MKNKKLVCPFLCMLFLFGCSSNTIEINKNPKQEVGENKQILEYETHYVESIQYPIIGIKPIDKKVTSIIHKHEKTFKKKVASYQERQKAEFNVTYESYMKNDRYISIALFFYERIYQNLESVETIVYDTLDDRFLSFDDVYDKQQVQELSSHVTSYFEERFPQECEQDLFRSHTSAIVSNFESFVLTKSKLLIYFEKGRIFDNSATFSIGYEDIAGATSLKNEAVETIVPYEDILNEPVKNIKEDQPMVALTFDDGPTRRYTTAILDALKENQASATFFILGSRANNAPDLLQRMVLEGSEIGNHTYSHKQLTTLSKENIEEEITATQESIYKITRRYPNVIRPPYGSKNQTVLECAQGKKIVSWTLDTKDWKSKNTKTIVDYVMKEINDGDIILLHDLYATSAQAAIILIPKLKEAGYQLVTVSDLYTYRPQTK